MICYVILLRGVNVGASRKLPMGDLRAAMRAGGYPDCETYIASGNLVLTAAAEPAVLEAAVERLIEADFSLRVEAIARSGAALAATAATNPFPDAQPKLLHLGLAKRPLRDDAAAALSPRATAGERVKAAGGGLWIDFAESGVARSRLTPAALDKAAGSSLTARNWNTVRKLVEMAGERPPQ